MLPTADYAAIRAGVAIGEAPHAPRLPGQILRLPMMTTTGYCRTDPRRVRQAAPRTTDAAAVSGAACPRIMI